MKTLKITFLLLAVVLLTASGLSSDTVTTNEEVTVEAVKEYDLMAHAKKNRLKASQG